MTRVAVIGGGLIGAGWAAAFAGAGLETRVVDPDPGASDRVAATWEQARAVLARLGNLADGAGPPVVVATFPQDGADLVQEALPESLDLKQRVLADVEQRVGPETVIASSSSSFTADAIAAGGQFDGMYVQVKQLPGAVDNAFGQTETQCKILQITRRCHHYRMGYAVINHRHRHLFGDTILTGGALNAPMNLHREVTGRWRTLLRVRPHHWHDCQLRVI